MLPGVSTKSGFELHCRKQARLKYGAARELWLAVRPKDANLGSTENLFEKHIYHPAR